MFLVKRIVGLRVLYIYSFAFNFVELGECTRIRGLAYRCGADRDLKRLVGAGLTATCQIQSNVLPQTNSLRYRATCD